MSFVLVEGVTDRIALEAVARRLALGLDGVEIVPIGGAQAVRRAAAEYDGQRVVGLCDAGEERYFRRVLGDATYVCDRDLEDELIRALGAERVQEVVAAEGELETFRNFQNQVYWRGRPVEAQLRRWLQNGGRYLRYPPRLVEALEPHKIPAPLAGVLVAAAGGQMAQWTAEIRVDEMLARKLVAAQFPPLPERSLEFLGEGWDYAAFLVDESLVFRFPRRQIGVAGTEREIAKLPALAPLLPVAIPRPLHIGRPSEDFPWPFYAAPFLPGAEPDGSLSDEARGALARPLAQVLRALHAPATLVSTGDGLPVDPMGRADMAVRVPRTRETLAAITELWQPPAEGDELLEQALELPAPEPSAVCHGDLHFRQLLVDGSTLAGIVDWVDLCRGDPAMDLSLVCGFLPRAARSEFFAEYGEVEPASLVRARVLALNLMSVLARYGHDEGMPGVKTEALAGLGRVFA